MSPTTNREIRDLGIECIPHWSADSPEDRIKYGTGVFIRDFEGDVNEVSIDVRASPVHFRRQILKTPSIVRKHRSFASCCGSGVESIPEG